MTSQERYRNWYQRNITTARMQKTLLMRKYRAENPEKHRAISRAGKKRLKDKVFAAYGNECISCGFEDIRALTLDHVRNNGAEEREEIGERGVYRRALIPEHRTDYQILCMNCQFIKRVEAGRQNQWLNSHGKHCHNNPIPPLDSKPKV